MAEAAARGRRRGDAVILRATAEPGVLALLFGPFSARESQAIRGESPSLERVLAGLADDVRVLAGAEGELLRLTFRSAGGADSQALRRG